MFICSLWNLNQLSVLVTQKGYNQYSHHFETPHLKDGTDAIQ